MCTSRRVSNQDHLVGTAISELIRCDVLVYPFSCSLHVVGTRGILDRASGCRCGLWSIEWNELMIDNDGDDALTCEILPYIAPILSIVSVLLILSWSSVSQVPFHSIACLRRRSHLHERTRSRAFLIHCFSHRSIHPKDFARQAHSDGSRKSACVTRGRVEVVRIAHAMSLQQQDQFSHFL